VFPSHDLDVKCKYGCEQLPCVHDKWPTSQSNKRQHYANDFVRPAIVNANGKPLVISTENQVSIERYYEQRERERLIDKINEVKQAITEMAKDDLSHS